MVHRQAYTSLSRQRDGVGASRSGVGQMPRLSIIPGHGEKESTPSLTSAETLKEPLFINRPPRGRLLTQICPRKDFSTTASPSQCLPWRCSSWASGGGRRLDKSSSWCSSLTPKGPGKNQNGLTQNAGFWHHIELDRLKVALILERDEIKWFISNTHHLTRGV